MAKPRPLPKCPEHDVFPKYANGYVETCMAVGSFVDEDGREHRHDTNILTQNFTCPEGHSYAIQRPHGCWCGWVQTTK